MLYRIGSSLPSWLVSPLAAAPFASINSSISSLPTSFVLSGLKNDLTALEVSAFDARCSDETAWAAEFAWMQEETGGMSEDMAVLLSASADIGLDYDRILCDL